MPNVAVSVRGHHAMRIPAVVVITAYAALLLCVPSRLIFAPLGAAGTPANLLGLGALLWWTCATVGGLNPVRGPTPLRVVTGLLIVAVAASYASGMAHGWYAPPDIHQITDPDASAVLYPVSEVNSKMVLAADRGLLSFSSWIGVTLLSAEGLRSWSDAELLVRWITWFGAGVALLGVIQFFSGIDVASFLKVPGLVANSDFGYIETRSIFRRVLSTTIHPIEFGVVMAAILPLALHRVIFDGRSFSTLVPTLLIGVSLPMSVSRSGILAGIVALAILFVGWPSAWRRIFLIVLPFAAILLRLIIPGLVGTILSLFTNFLSDPSITGRTSDYDVVFRVFSDNPILGRGLFTFVPRYYRILDNQFLMILIELGIIGMLAVVSFFAVAFLCARGSRRAQVSVRQRQLGFATSAGLGGMVVSYATFDAWGFPMAAGLTFLLAGLAGTCWRLSRQNANPVVNVVV